MAHQAARLISGWITVTAEEPSLIFYVGCGTSVAFGFDAKHQLSIDTSLMFFRKSDIDNTSDKWLITQT
jgi:hypothetical protein